MSQCIATVALCKCSRSRKLFGVRFEKVSHRNWKYTWSFPMRESEARREGFDAIEIDGDIVPDAGYPGCPDCKAEYFALCSCGKLSCLSGTFSGQFQCAWCGFKATLTDYDGGGFQSSGDR